MKVQLFVELTDTEDFEGAGRKIKLFANSLGCTDGQIEKTGDDFMEYAIMNTKITEWSYSAIQNAYLLHKDEVSTVGIRTDDKEIYLPALNTDDSRIKLNELAFGSLWNHTFSNHFNLPCLVCYEDNVPVHLKEAEIRFSAEYDRSQIVVYYSGENKRTNSKFNRNPKNANKKIIAYTVTFPFKSICRIIYDCVKKKVYFGLRNPPIVRIGNCNTREQMYTTKYNRAFYIEDPINNRMGCREDCLVDCDVFRINLDIDPDTVHRILARLCNRLSLSIETKQIKEKYLPRFYKEPSIYTPDFRSHFAEICSKNGFLGNENWFLFLKNYITSKADQDCIEYLLETLLSRGSVVKNQLLREDQWKRFIAALIMAQSSLGATAVCEVLKALIYRVDECKPISSIINYIVKKSDKYLNSSQNNFTERDGYIQIRRVIITPTRVLPMVPDVIKGNRVLRKYGAENMFRAAFRDDNGEMIRGPRGVHEKVKLYMKKGIFLQGCLYGYLGSSTSQMRDGGAYYHLAITDDDFSQIAENISNSPFYSIERIHNELGSFEKLVFIEKYMARLGQCFTQSQAARHHLQPQYLLAAMEVIGGSYNRSPFIFSDGCGRISLQMAKSLALELGIPDSVPSTFQIRLGGYKGVLCVDPFMDEVNSFKKNNQINEVELHLALRHSQEKFHTDNVDGHPLEIVKFSGVTNVNLNKPFIMILDQESERQSLSCHRRITARIEELLDAHLIKLAKMLLEEKEFFNTLVDLPNNFGIRDLNDIQFRLIDEPFFRSQVRAVVIYGIVKQLSKLQISIPAHLGRCMFGVIDETGLLQSGQVFVQFSNSTRGYTPSSETSKTIVTGKILVTKSPSVVCGDVRVFTAVNIPQLSHLVDVIVFPQHGPRPHSDEMAGSDLDGDEYLVIWDKELLLEKNAPAAMYGKQTAQTKPIRVEQLNNEMCEYFVNYLSGDSVGTISNAHLFQADLRGINSAVCKVIAKKVNEAVDFPKSGIAPKQLTNNWNKDRYGRNVIPPEKMEMYPDYHSSYNHRPTYISHRLIGRLYRQLKDVEDTVRNSVIQEQKEMIEVDPLFLHPKWKEYVKEAKDDMLAYKNSISGLMSVYGVKTEGELFSGYITEFSRGYNACEDNTMFNTERAVKERLTIVLREYRQRFFGNTEADWLNNTTSINDRNPDQPDILKRRINNTKENLLAKASAYYAVCYGAAAESFSPQLSFPWIVADVLAEVRKFHFFKNQELTMSHRSRLHKVLHEQIRFYWETKFSSKHKVSMIEKLSKIGHFRHYFTVYPDLTVICIFIYRWWLLVRPTMDITSQHICMLLIRFAYSNTDSRSCQSTYIQKYDPLDVEHSKKRLTVNNYVELLIRFIEYLASNKFKQQISLSFMSDGFPSIFIRNEWHQLHKQALKCFYNLIFTMKIREFTVCKNSGPNKLEVEEYECEPFVINVAESIDLNDIARIVCSKLGIPIQFRRFDHKNKRLVSVMAIGDFDSLQKLRTMLSVVPGKHTNYADKDQYEKLVDSAPIYST